MYFIHTSIEYSQLGILSVAPIHLLKEHQKPSTAGLLDFRASLREREKNPPKFSFFTEGSKVLALLCQF